MVSKEPTSVITVGVYLLASMLTQNYSLFLLWVLITSSGILVAKWSQYLPLL